MKRTALVIVSLFIFTGISQGVTQSKTTSKRDETPNGNELRQNLTLCQRLSSIAEKLEMSAKASYWKKEYRTAIDFYHLLLKAGKSEFDDLYNLACCYGQMGDDKRAAKYLKLAVEEGFTSIDHIKSDPDFEKVKNSPKFQKTMTDITNKISQTDNSRAVQAEETIQTTAIVELAITQGDKN